MRCAITNRVAGATITATSDAGGVYGKDNLKTPQRPFLPARTTATGAQSWTIDLGSALAVDVWGLIRVNVVSCSIQADDAITFDSAAGLPQHDSGVLTIPRNLNERFHYAYRPGVTITRRYHRLTIPNQATTDAAAYYLVGGLFAGPWVTTLPLPKSDYELEKIEPHEDLELRSGGSQRLELGDPLVHLTLHREASDVPSAPVIAGTDELSVWTELDRQLRVAGFGFWLLRDEHPGMAWVMKRLGQPRWMVDTYQSTGVLELIELVR